MKKLVKGVAAIVFGIVFGILMVLCVPIVGLLNLICFLRLKKTKENIKKIVEETVPLLNKDLKLDIEAYEYNIETERDGSDIVPGKYCYGAHYWNRYRNGVQPIFDIFMKPINKTVSLLWVADVIYVTAHETKHYMQRWEISDFEKSLDMKLPYEMRRCEIDAHKYGMSFLKRHKMFTLKMYLKMLLK